VSTIIGLVIAFVFFDWPWRAFILIAFLLFDAIEIAIWIRWRRKRSLTGSEAMTDERGTAVTNCRPEGRVKVRGHTWKAHCDGGVDAGEEIIVTGIEGLQLEVRAAEKQPARMTGPL
jgi:membrane protein implicated in regulation of membrane protease activity